MNIRQKLEELAQAEAAWKAMSIRRIAFEASLHTVRVTGWLDWFLDEERRLQKKWQDCQNSLMDANDLSQYSEEALRYFSSQGIVAVGLWVTIVDEETGEAEIIKVTHDDSPINRAIKNRQAGETVLVQAPGGDFTYKISHVAVVTKV